MPLLILLNAILLYVVRPLRPLLQTALRPRSRTAKRRVNATSARKVDPTFAREANRTPVREVNPTLASPPSREVIGPMLIVLALCWLGLSIYVKIHDRHFDEESLTAAGPLYNSPQAECGEQCDHPACGVCNMGEQYATARLSVPTKLAAYQYCCPLRR
ncbi:hypothetical protein K523DRAFT_320673 [Schizophyllum commune Tattone D]|nr:hypothetical protein K523DRAFT_320673 [Schizophyllum commune Tattone D]